MRAHFDDHKQHAHSSGHHQHGAPATQRRAFLTAIGLNWAFVAIKFTYGLLANSTALVADAGHNLSDVLTDNIMRTLKDRFSIQHSTLQAEEGTTDHVCALHHAAG